MPPLRNERHEIFAQALAAGKSAADRSAGYQCAPHKARGHGHRLRTREDIAARVDELLLEARGRVTERDAPAKKPRERKGPTLPKFQQKRRAGRPPIYEEAFCPRARKLALLGFTEVEIAEQFGISPDTIQEWKAKHGEFSVALEGGKAEADAEVAASLYERATGAKIPAVKIFLGPCKEGESPQPIYAPYTRYHPPETGAAKLWLINRQPHLVNRR